MYPHFFDGAKKRRYPSKKRFPTPAVCSRKRCPLHKGTKTLHQKNGGSDSRPPSFRPTAVFILHLPPGYFWLDLDGWYYNPSVIAYAMPPPFAQGRLRSALHVENKKRALNLISALDGDPCENRTRVTAVKGPCLNRLTNGPLW